MTQLVTRPGEFTPDIRTRQPARRLGPIVLVVPVLSLVGVYVLTRYLSSVQPVDFLVYRYGAARALAGQDLYASNIHGPMLPPVGLPFTYTPFAAVLLAPITVLSWQQAYLWWSLANVAIMGWALQRMIPIGTRRRGWLLAVALSVALATSVMNREVEYGQINVLLMGLCLLDLFRRSDTRTGRWLPRGVLVGLAAAVKLTPGLFIVFFLISRQRRLAAWSVGAAVAATGVGALLHPATSRSFFGSVMWTLSSRVDLGQGLGSYGNNSIQGAFAALGDWTRPLAVVTTGCAAVGSLLAARAVHRRGDDVGAWLIIGAAAPAISPISWIHHWVYLLPALLLLALRSSSLRSRWLVGLATISLIIGPGPGNALLHDLPPSLLFVAVPQRECLLLIAVGVVIALARNSQTRLAPYHREQERLR